jgi:hypothetical protein
MGVAIGVRYASTAPVQKFSLQHSNKGKKLGLSNATHHPPHDTPTLLSAKRDFGPLHPRLFAAQH